MIGVLFKGDSKLVVTDVEKPVPTGDEVLVRVRSSGVCGSDLHRFHLPAEELGEMTTVVPGHELSGEVIEVGPDVKQRRVGDRVLGYLKVGCQECWACRADAPTQCRNIRILGRDFHGSDGEFCALPEWAAMPIPDSISYAEGAIISCNYGTAYSAVMKTRLAAASDFDGDPLKVVVFGVGPVGLCAVATAVALGGDVAAVDLSSRRLELAKSYGASYSVNASTSNVVDTLRDWTGGRGVDVSIECSGSEAGRRGAMDLAAPLGDIVMVGNGAGDMMAPTAKLKAKETTMRGSVVFHPSELSPMLEFIQAKSIALLDMVDHEMTIEGAAEAFDLAARQDTGKIIFNW